MLRYLSSPHKFLIPASVLIPLCLFAFMMWQDYNVILNEATSNTVRTASIFEQHALNVFETHQLIAERVNDRLRGMSWDEIARSDEIRTYLEAIEKKYPQVQAIWLADPTGIIRNSSKKLPDKQISVADRDYFQALRKTGSELFIGNIVKPRVLKHLNFNIAGCRNNGSKTFDGVIAITVFPEYFSNFWNRITSPETAASILMRSDGSVLARSLGIDPQRLTLPPDSEPMQSIRNADQGTYIAKSVHQSVKRIFAFKKIEKYNVYIFTSISMQSVLHKWREHLLYYGGYFSIAAFILFLLSLAVNRHAANELMAKEALSQTNIALEAARTETENKRRLLEAVMLALPVGVAITDEKGGTTMGNRVFEEIWGGPIPQTNSVADYVDYKAWWADSGEPVLPEEWASAVAVQKGEIVTGQMMRIQRFDGSEIFVINSASPVRDAAGNIAGSAVAILDITKLKLVENELHKAHDELEKRVMERTIELTSAMDGLIREINERKKPEKALHEETSDRLRAVEALREKEQMLIQQSRQAAMGEMIGNIAHQWRQPLNTLGLFTQRLGYFYGTPDFNKEFLDTSVAKSMEIIQYMSRTIDDFRNFFSSNREKAEFKVIDAVNSALSLVDASFTDRRIRIEKKTLEGVCIFGVANEYAQVLLNILINAKDVINERNIESPVVTISIISEHDASVVTIADNAGGVSEDIIGKIFDPYFTTKGPQQGTGVGLFMCRTIIENSMGGRLSVRNTDEGAEFRIEV